MEFKRLLHGIRKVGGKTLYFPGCHARFVAPELEARYRRILSRLGVNYIELSDVNCCGSPVINAGYKEDFYELVKKNLELLRQNGVTHVISHCPSCCCMFKNKYGLDVSHVSQIMARKKRKLPKGSDRGPICYHDPCHLARTMGITSPPREVLARMGYEVVEMKASGENTLCCGAGGGLKANDPDLANRAAHNRLGQCRSKRLVTACPSCYTHLKENAAGMEVSELSELVEGADER